MMKFFKILAAELKERKSKGEDGLKSEMDRQMSDLPQNTYIPSQEDYS